MSDPVITTARHELTAVEHGIRLHKIIYKKSKINKNQNKIKIKVKRVGLGLMGAPAR